jgi:hypothetical protein
MDEIHFDPKFWMMCSAHACASSFRCSGTNGAPCAAITSTCILARDPSSNFSRGDFGGRPLGIRSDLDFLTI